MDCYYIISSITSSLIGVILSYHFDASTGASIILLQATFFVIVLAYSKIFFYPSFSKRGQPDNIIYILTRGHRLNFSRKLIIIPNPLEIDDALDRDRCDATACTFF